MTLVVCLQASQETLLLQMPALRRASFTAQPCYMNFIYSHSMLRINRDSFVGAAKLEYLSLTGLATVKLMPDCVSVLAGLATLKLASCGLTCIPAALTALAGSLTHLALPRNHALQMTDEDVMTILALRQLQLLDLRKRAPQAAVTYEGMQMTELAFWSMRSLQRLCNLQAGYHAQHGRLVTLEMYHEDEAAPKYDDTDSEEEAYGTEADTGPYAE